MQTNTRICPVTKAQCLIPDCDKEYRCSLMEEDSLKLYKPKKDSGIQTAEEFLIEFCLDVINRNDKIFEKRDIKRNVMAFMSTKQKRN